MRHRTRSIVVIVTAIAAMVFSTGTAMATSYLTKPQAAVGLLVYMLAKEVEAEHKGLQTDRNTVNETQVRRRSRNNVAAWAKFQFDGKWCSYYISVFLTAPYLVAKEDWHSRSADCFSSKPLRIGR